jgi:predicted nucleic acid-binding Zn ribbon protein
MLAKQEGSVMASERAPYTGELIISQPTPEGDAAHCVVCGKPMKPAKTQGRRICRDCRRAGGLNTVASDFTWPVPQESAEGDDAWCPVCERPIAPGEPRTARKGTYVRPWVKTARIECVAFYAHDACLPGAPAWRHRVSAIQAWFALAGMRDLLRDIVDGRRAAGDDVPADVVASAPELLPIAEAAVAEARREMDRIVSETDAEFRRERPGRPRP